MANRRRPSDSPSLEIRRFTPESAEQAIRLLEARVGDVKALEAKRVRHDDEQARATERKIRGTVLEVFGERSREYQDHQYHGISGGLRVVMGGFDHDEHAADIEDQQNFLAGIPRSVTMLEGLIATVRERTDSARPVPGRTTEMAPSPITDEVFIVHGRADGRRESVARFVERFGLRPIILHEQASEGRTIIEKIEQHSAVAYAVVLLTGDDRGGLVGADPTTYQPRARQNVVLELGYFLGKLGRRHVCVLHEPGVEIPSDYDGVVYVPLDPGDAWKLRLAREMKATAFRDIDLNRAM
jgi:predicted nucleotide-binding protein